jgi:Flp pilus assembly protein TadD
MNRQQRRAETRRSRLAPTGAPAPTDQVVAAAARQFQAGRLAEAEHLLRQLLASQPRHAVALHLLGVIANISEQHEAAFDLVSRSIAANPRDATAHSSLGNMLIYRGRLDEAVASYRRALSLDPALPQALVNLGNALHALNRLDEAEASYLKAINIRPDDPETHYNRGMLMLARGDMPAGWAEHEWRLKTPMMTRNIRSFAQPQWRGEAAPGKTLLIHVEQGFGDALHFCRYAPLASARGLRVMVEAPAPLVRLMRHLKCVDRVITRGEALPHFDLHCPMLSVPAAMGTTMETIPADVPYLRADPGQVAAWRARLEALGRHGPRVGLTWEGGVNKELATDRAIGRRRSISPSLLAPLFDVTGVQFFSLQKEGTRAPDHFPLIDFMGEMTDFADTAALVENLDLVISIDTSVVHLAGALGKPVWLMDRFIPCWRWLIGRRDSPWYPTLRLYRQPSPTDWHSVVAEVARDLRDWAEAATARPNT